MEERRREQQRNLANRLRHNTVKIISGDGSGTGFAIRHAEEFYILTNAHVVDGSSNMEIHRPPDQFITAKVIAIDYVNDIALLDFVNEDPFISEDDPIYSAAISFSGGCSPGDDILVCGFPLDCDEPRVVRGIVSGYHALPIEGRMKTRLVVQAPVNPGNSGGPICDLEGNLVGVLYAGEHKIRIDDPLPDFPGAREIIEYLRQRLTPNDGYGYALDLGHVRAMVETVIDSRPDGRHLDGEVWNTFEMPRRDFIALQAQIDQIPEKPPGTSCIGPFNFWEDKLRLGWKGKSQVELTPPASWIKMCKSKLNKMSHFYLRGHTVVGYKKAPGYKQARWVNQTEIVLT